MTDSYRTAAECREALEQLVANTEDTSQRAMNYLWGLEQRLAEAEAAGAAMREALRTAERRLQCSPGNRDVIDIIYAAIDIDIGKTTLARIADLEEVLRAVQWRGDIGHRLTNIGLCPACGSGQNIYDQHGYGCPIGKVLTAKPTSV